MKKDPAEAVRLLRMSSDLGHPKAQLLLGRMLATGQYVEKDREAGLALIRAAASRGLDLAKEELARLGETIPAGETDRPGGTARAPTPAPPPRTVDVRPAVPTPGPAKTPAARPTVRPPTPGPTAVVRAPRRSGRLRAPPPMPPAELGPTLDIRRITDADYAGAIAAAEAGARALFGPMTAEQEKAFAAKWSPLYRFPYAEWIEYANKFNPLVSQFLAAKTAFDEAAQAYDRAQVDLVLAFASEDDAEAPFLLDEIELQMGLMKSYSARMAVLSRQLAALGDPPDLSALLARARKRHDDAIDALSRPEDGRRYLRVAWEPMPEEFANLEGVTWSSRHDDPSRRVTRRYIMLVPRCYLGWRSPGGGGGMTAWYKTPPEVRDEEKASVGWRVVDQEFKTQNDFEAEYADYRKDVLGDYRTVRVHFDTLKIGDRTAFRYEWFGVTEEKAVNAEARYKVGCFIQSGHPRGYWTSSEWWAGKEWVEWTFEGEYVTRQRSTEAGYEPLSQTFARRNVEAARLHKKWQAMAKEILEGLTVESVASVPPADDQAMFFLDDEDGTRRTESPAERVARLKREWEAKRRKEAEVLQQKKVALIQADIDYFAKTVENLRRDLVKVDPASREAIRGRLLVAEADLQRAKDEMEALRTGVFTRTRTKWDDYNEAVMRQQSREMAETLDGLNRQVERMDRMISLADEGERGRLREFWNRALARNIPAGRFEDIDRAAVSIFDSVSGAHEKEAARQEELALAADRRMSYAQNVKTISDYTLNALGMIASAGQGGTYIYRSLTAESAISTVYSVTTGYLERGPVEAAKQLGTSYSDVAALFSMAMDTYHDSVLAHLEQHAADPSKTVLDETGAGLRGVLWAAGAEGANALAKTLLLNPACVALRDRMDWNTYPKTATGGINWPEARSPFGRPAGGGGGGPGGGLPAVPRATSGGINWDLGTGNGKWPTTQELMQQASFQSRQANGRAMVNLFKQRNDALNAACAAGAKESQLRPLRTKLEEAYRVVENDLHAKSILKRVARYDEGLAADYNAIDREHTCRLLTQTNARLRQQGVAEQEFQLVRNSASAGSVSMDFDITHAEPPRWTIGADGGKTPNPAYVQWRSGLTRTLPDGTVVRLTPYQYRLAAQQAMREAYRETYGREPQEAFLNFTDSEHGEAYKDRFAWTGERTDLPHADFPNIDPQWASQAGDVTAFKVRTLSRDHPSMGAYSALLENCRGLAKDFETKLFGGRPETPEFGAADRTLPIHPNSPIADTPAPVQAHFQALYGVVKDFSEDRISPIQAERRIRELTGGRGVAEIAEQMKVVFSGLQGI